MQNLENVNARGLSNITSKSYAVTKLKYINSQKPKHVWYNNLLICIGLHTKIHTSNCNDLSDTMKLKSNRFFLKTIYEMQ
jgi:hypothetical protein